MSSSFLSRAAAICALCYVSAFLGLASVLFRMFGFPLDDSWIHEVVARNLAEYKVLGFVPGQLTSGSTSLLWTIILTIRGVLFPRVSAVIYCLAISVVILAFIGYAMKRMMEKDGLPEGTSWCLALAPAASGNFLWFGLIGMEHLLFILLSILIITYWFGSSYKAEQHRAALPIFSFLLVLTRPEGVVLIAILWVFRSTARRSAREWAEVAAGAALGGSIGVVMNWKTGHHLTPLTMQGRNWVNSSSGWLTLHARFVTHTYARMLSVWNIDLPQSIFHGRGLLIGVPLTFSILAFIVLAVRRVILAKAHRFLLLCVWGVTIEFLYFFMLPDTGHGGRYIAVVIMLFLPLVFLGLREALKFVVPNERGAWSLVGLTAFATAAVSIYTWSLVATADIEQINTEHGEIAQWIEKNIPAGSIEDRQIAVYDIGRIGYQLGGNLVDLGGLVDYRYAPYLVHRRTAEYLRDRNVKYVVLPGNEDDATSEFFSRRLSLDKAHGVDLRLMHTACANSIIARLARAATETADPCQRLYAIDYAARSK